MPGSPDQAAELQALSVRAAVYATRARSESIRRAYRSAWSVFGTWCAAIQTAHRLGMVLESIFPIPRGSGTPEGVSRPGRP